MNGRVRASPARHHRAGPKEPHEVPLCAGSAASTARIVRFAEQQQQQPKHAVAKGQHACAWNDDAQLVVVAHRTA